MKWYTIARRAYGEYTEVESFNGNWFEAQNRAARVQYENQDGEYFSFGPGEKIGSSPSPYFQSGLDYL